MDRIKDITAKLVETKDWPEFGAGDTVTVTLKIKEGNKERLQAFQGVVLQRRGSGATETFTVRKMASGVGVERIFPISSPSLDSIVVNKRGKVRRARIYYLRERTGKAARIKERAYDRSKDGAEKKGGRKKRGKHRKAAAKAKAADKN